MNPKNTCLLVLLAGGLFAFLYFVEPRLRPKPVAPEHVIPNLQPKSVNEVVLDLAGKQEIRAERTNGGWLLTKPMVYPANSEAIEALLQAAAELQLTPQTYISAAELKGRLTMNTEYGFDTPKATVTFGGHPKLILGFNTAPGDQIYAQLVGLEGVDILDADFFKKYFPRTVDDWRDILFAHFSTQDFDKLSVAVGAQAFTLQRDGSNQVWRMATPVRTRADYPKIDALLAKLQKLEVAAFVTDKEQPDLEAFGLRPAALELNFDHGTNRLLKLAFGKSPTNHTDYVYARCGNQNSIVLVPREPIAAWLGGFQEFRDHHLLRLANTPPDSIEITNSSTKDGITLQHVTNELWDVTSPGNFPADTNVVHNLLTNLTALEVEPVNGAVAVNDAVLPDVDLAGYGLAIPSRRFLLKQSPAHLAPGVTNPVIADLTFGFDKDGLTYVRRADRPEETSVYAVKTADVQKLAGAVLQFHPHRIWAFTEDDVVAITIRQGGNTQRLLHKAPNRWTITAGSGMINELQVEVAAQELGFLEAVALVQRGDTNRAKFGFTDRSLQIGVELKGNGKPQTLTLDIAEFSPRGTSPHGLRYGFARMNNGEDWVFEIPDTFMDMLGTYLNIHEHAVP